MLHVSSHTLMKVPHIYGPFKLAEFCSLPMILQNALKVDNEYSMTQRSLHTLQKLDGFFDNGLVNSTMDWLINPLTPN